MLSCADGASQEKKQNKKKMCCSASTRTQKQKPGCAPSDHLQAPPLTVPAFHQSEQAAPAIGAPSLPRPAPTPLKITRSASYFIPSCLLSAEQSLPLIPTQPRCQTAAASLVIL